ncbi:uncharacterized protein [Asterias amurensis]|uniref:uncharacterized protein isoform X2 n=1 Tax=Asterias amurensis TaxID=7602 RepID=UPI003AB69A06
MECHAKISTILLLIILTVPQEGTSRRNGAPIEACSTLMPQHPETAPQSSETIPYLLDTDGDTYTPGGTVRVRLVTEGPRYDFFRGFILQARRRDNGTPFGSWQVPPTDVIFWRHLLCPDTDYIKATITHIDNTAKYPPLSPDNFITWNAPELVQSNPETVDFVASVVYNFTTYWVNLQKSVTLSNNINECDSNPCQNGGNCQDGINRYTCTCQAGWAGTVCSIYLNNCDSNPCQNGGNCQDGINHYTCMCQAGWIGTFCSIISDTVSVCQSSPCLNNGTCFTSANLTSYFCQCQVQFTGTHCENVNPCTSNPCLNGGSCTFVQNIIHCVCASAFYGQSCEVDPCDSHPCNNGGSCEHFGSKIRCFCADGFIGTSCDVDLEHPKLLYCPENIVAYITSATAQTLSVMWAEPNGTDNSQSVSVILASPKGPGSNFSLGSTSMIRYFITDPSYNAVECLFSVTVEDKAPPIITYCPANITQQVTSVTQPGLFITWSLPEAFDLSNQNVTIVLANESQPMPGSFFSVRSTSVIQYNISDVLNNTAFCSFTVTVHLCVCYTNATMQAEGNVCIIDNSCSIDAILQDISEVPVDEENVEQIAAVLAIATGYYDRIQTNGVGSVGSTMESIAAVGSPSVQVTEMVIETVDNILNVEAESFASNQPASAMILQAFESQLTNPRDNISLTRENIIVLVVSSSPQSDSKSLGFAIIPEDGNIDETLLNNDEELFIGDDKIPVAEAEASILIPEEAFTPGIANSTANFVVYQNAKLFQVAQVKGLYVDGRVISGTLSGQDKRVTNLTNPVVTSFRPLNNTSTADRICVFWDPTLVAGNSVGNWSTKGCRLAEDRGVGEAKVCHCDHLTNFAILISHRGDAMDLVLDILSKIGCGISIAALILTILTTLTSSDLSSVPRKTLLNLCVSLTLLYGVFLIGIELIQPRVACIIFAALIHYFFLSSVCWSSAEAFICFYLLVLTRRNLVRGYLLRMMIFCWGVPALIVFVSLAVPYFGSGQWNVPEGKYCFLSPGNPIFFGVLLPVGALLLFNIFIYILVFRRLVCQRVESTLTRQETRAELVLRQARTMIPISILLGGTWIFGLLAIDIFSVTFQYIFAILNSLIGLAVFIFFVLMRKKGRQGLRNLLCCRSKDSMGSSGARGSHSTSDTRLRNSGNINSNTT